MYVVILKISNMSIITTVLVQHMPEFSGEKDKVTWRISQENCSAYAYISGPLLTQQMSYYGVVSQS